MSSHPTRHYVFVALALTIVLISPGWVKGQACDEEIFIQFQPYSEPGERSFITEHNTTVHVRQGIPMPLVVIQVLYNLTSGSSPEAVLAGDRDDLVVTATLDPALPLGGNVEPVVVGKARFQSLVVLEDFSSGNETYRLVFTLSSSSTEKALEQPVAPTKTGTLVAVAEADIGVPAELLFSNAGFFFRTNQARKVSENVVLPAFVVEVVDKLWNIAPSFGTVKVSLSGGGVAEPSEFLMSYGLALVDTLRITFPNGVPGVNATQPRITVTMGGLSVSTGNLIVETEPRQAFVLLPNPLSVFSTDNLQLTAVLGIPLPAISLQILTSSFEVDTTASGLIVTATTAQGVLENNRVMSWRGVATFTDLTYVGQLPRTSVITFTAGDQLVGFQVTGDAIYTDVVMSDSPVKSKHLSLSGQSDMPTYGSAVVRYNGTHVTIPKMIFMNRDSAYRVDPSGRGAVGLVASIQSKPLPSGILTRGAVAFAEFYLEPSNPLSDNSRISLVAQGPNTAGLTPQLLPIREDSPEARKVFLRFASPKYSHISNSDQTFAAVGAKLPTVAVEVANVFGGVVTQDIGLQVRAFTKVKDGEPLDEAYLRQESTAATVGQFVEGRHSFNCLQFDAEPQEVVKLYFGAFNTTTGRFITDIPIISSGFVTFTSSIVRAFDVRFSSRHPSLIQYNDQSTAAVTNIAIPPIYIQVVDSAYQPDLLDDSTVVEVSVTSGELYPDGLTATAERGVVLFTRIRFKVAGSSTKLQFRVSASTGPALGRIVTSGEFLVTEIPLNEYQIRRGVGGVMVPTVSTQQLPFVYETTVFVLDSAHVEQTTKVDPAMQVEIRSTVGIVGNETNVTLDSSCNCFNVKAVIEKYRQKRYEGMLVGVTAVVTRANSFALGTEIDLLNLAVTSYASAEGCSAAEKPVVVVEVETPYENVLENIDNTRQQLANLMGISVERVNLPIDLIAVARGTDLRTGTRWTGTRMEVSFEEPFETSTNRESSKSLAAEFLDVKIGCTTDSLNLRRVFDKSKDKSCSADGLEASIKASDECADGDTSALCTCFDDNAIKNWGRECAEDTTVKPMMEEMCKKLTDCSEFNIVDICEDISAPKSVSLEMIVGVIGGVIGLILLLVILCKLGCFKRRREMLNKSLQR